MNKAALYVIANSDVLEKKLNSNVIWGSAILTGALIGKGVLTLIRRNSALDAVDEAFEEVAGLIADVEDN